jgi:hypothetical protein
MLTKSPDTVGGSSENNAAGAFEIVPLRMGEPAQTSSVCRNGHGTRNDYSLGGPERPMALPARTNNPAAILKTRR